MRPTRIMTVTRDLRVWFWANDGYGRWVAGIKWAGPAFTDQAKLDKLVTWLKSDGQLILLGRKEEK